MGAAIGVLNRDILPPLSEVIPYLLQGSGAAEIGLQQVSYGEAIAHLLRVAIGLGLGLVAAIPLGTLVAIVPLMRHARHYGYCWLSKHPSRLAK